MANLGDIALRYQRTGLAVLPARLAEKRPALAGWKDYQSCLPTEAEVAAWFANRHDALCLVTGAVSGNLELIDFDNGGELFDRWAQLVEAEAPGLTGRLVIEQSQSGGRHAIYRCAVPVCGNIHLAQRAIPTPDDKPLVITGKTYKPRRNASAGWEITLTLIETRGEGGLFLCHPTPGYGLLQGQIEDLPLLTAEERDVLLEAAWSLNEVIPPPVAVPPETYSAPSYPQAERPGDAFNTRGDVTALLVQHGWTLARDGENQYWRRPGKSKGWSATLKDRVFYVFSSNAAPFDGPKAYGPFAVYTILEHGGDYTRAACALRSQGYGTAPLPPPLSPPPMVPVAGAATPQLLQPVSVRTLLGKYPDLRPPILHGLLREGETMNLISAPKIGKALAVDTPILTDQGWVTMGDLRPGMRVHAADGSLTPVVAVTEIMHDRPCYRITTKSSATLVADANHLWIVVQRGHQAVVTTESLGHGYRGRRWLLPVAEAIQRDPIDLPLDPWLLGYWLGNGVAREGAISINQQDVDETVAEVRRAGFDVGKPAIKGGCTAFTVLGLRVILRRMGLLNCKHIPDVYLLASQEQRAALLAGLLDSDAHASTHKNGSGIVEFTTTDQDLFFQTLMLIRSLGHKASTSVGRAQLNGVDCGHKLRIIFAASRGSSPFRFARRTAALPRRSISQRTRRDAVESVVAVPSVPVKCIEVAHPSGLFLAGHDLVVTHNSWLVTDLALAI
ncbi:MAG: bifunctional DNA primase/polymerase, partial [Phycisphaerae bacterium]